MNISLIAMEFPPDPVGGIGTFAFELVHGLIDRGHRVTVIIPSSHDLAGTRGDDAFTIQRQSRESEGNLTIIRWHSQPPDWMRWRPGFLWHRWRLRRLLHQLHGEDPFDLVETQDLYGPLPFGGIKGIPTVVRHHSTSYYYDSLKDAVEPKSMVYWSERATLRKTTHHVAVSQFVASGVENAFGIPKEHLTVIPYGIDTDLFCPSTTIKPYPGRIVFVNSVTPRKGVRELCQAFTRVFEAHPESSLQLIGRADRPMPDGSLYRDNCLAGLPEPVKERITFSGPMNRDIGLVQAIQQAQVCCFPSHLETFGIAPVEAMAVGKPVVYMGHGPGPEIITHGENGLLCDTKDPNDIAAKIIQFLGNPTLAQRCAENARKRALDFARPQWISQNLHYYESLFAGESSATP